jgi:hypothetical protein
MEPGWKVLFRKRKWNKEASRIGMGSSHGDIRTTGPLSEVFM